MSLPICRNDTAHRPHTHAMITNTLLPSRAYRHEDTALHRDCSNVLYISPLFMIQNSLKNTVKSKKACEQMSNGYPTKTASVIRLNTVDKASIETIIVNELPASLITELMKIAEACVIKSQRVSRDETPDFVQNCLLKLLLQIEKQRVVSNQDQSQYFIIKQDGNLLEIERWFGTAATNISIDRYRRMKHQVDGFDIAGETRDNDDQKPTFLVPEPSTDLEDELREAKIQEMSIYCAEAVDDCMSETWIKISQDNYKNFTLSFTDNAQTQDKGTAVANYCQIILEDKYHNDGKKITRHESVCDELGIMIRPENISHKKKKFEQLMMQCVANKVDLQFESTTKNILQDD